jgi:hypothetical protein
VVDLLLAEIGIFIFVCYVVFWVVVVSTSFSFILMEIDDGWLQKLEATSYRREVAASGIKYFKGSGHTEF